MNRPLRVLGVSGSMRQQSRSAIALRLFLDTVEQHGAEARMLDFRTIELPIYRPDREVHLERRLEWFCF